MVKCRCKPADSGKIVRRVVEVMALLAWRTSKIEMVAEVPSELPLATVDVNRLEQVMQNLLHNAVRHTAPGGLPVVFYRMESRASHHWKGFPSMCYTVREPLFG